MSGRLSRRGFLGGGASAFALLASTPALSQFSTAAGLGFSALQSGGGVVTDPYWPETALLLHGTGANAANNSTYLDSSTNNLTITKHGAITQGSVSPYSPEYSNLFDGSSYITTAVSSGLALGTNNFTIEFWIYPTSSAAAGLFNASAWSIPYSLTIYNGTFYASSNGSSWNIASAALSYAPPINTWSHVAVVRNGTTFTVYVNGVSSATATSALGIYQATNIFTIGDYSLGVTGNISNFRVVNGTAVYTAGFTPPTAPLTAVASTSLLTCQSNCFLDNSSNALALTVTGTVKVVAFNPFHPGSAYTTATNGGSAGFDGSTGYLTGPTSNAAYKFSGDFTVECWVYQTAAAQAGGSFIIQTASAAGSSAGIGVALYPGGGVSVYIAGSWYGRTSASITPLNSWIHIALTRSGSSCTVWVNGVSSGTFTNSTNFSDGYCTVATAVSAAASLWVTGYISDLRVNNTTALYTVGFTPPTAPLSSATSGTSLLLCGTNGAIFDSAMQNNVTAFGSMQISTSAQQFGSGSLYFNGSTNYMTVTNPALTLGTADFTIEFWVNPVATTGSSGIIDTRVGGSGLGVIIYWGGTGHLYYQDTVVSCGPTSSTLSNGTWYHVAVTRYAGTATIWVNGVSNCTAGSDTANFTNTPWFIGKQTNNSAIYNGYIQDLRVTPGVARYTTTFSPPAALFPAK